MKRWVEFIFLLCALVLALFMFTSCGRKGDTGLQGATGPSGPTGNTGTSGKDATQITTVQFCQGQVGIYPTTFPEQGLCINGNLYAVYWDNKNAFLSQLYPGTYISTSTGLQCTFTVLPNCEIE